MTQPDPSHARSLTVFAGQVPGNTQRAVYQVPPEYVLLLKTVSSQNGGNVNNSLTLMALQVATSVTSNILQINYTPFEIRHDPFWVVLSPGDTLSALAGPQPVQVWLSGALIAA